MTGIDDCVAFVLGKAYQRVHGELKLRLAPFGLTVPQYSLLAGLWERDGRSPAQLRERLVMDSATITGVIDRLERDALIRRERDTVDRRVTRLYLTDAAWALEDGVQQVIDDLNADVAALLPAGEIEMLLGRLRRVAKAPTDGKSEDGNA